MMKTLICLLCTNLLMVLISNGQSERDNILKVSEQFSKDYVSGNIKAVADAYTDDAVLMAPEKEIIYGRQAIYDFWMSIPKGVLSAHRTVPDTLIIKGNEAHDFGYGFVTRKTTDGTLPQERSVLKYYIIWVKDKSGAWKMKMDMWNTRNPNWNK